MAASRRPGAVVLAAAIALTLAGCRGEHQGPGEIKGKTVPGAVVAARTQKEQQAAARVAPAGERPVKQVLFGDLHVHTTFSADAFMRSLPIVQGEGVHPPADACDYARYCSALDFWSITDHAEGLTPDHWQDTKESIRQCNAVAGDPKNPDVVAFLGWEWTQVGTTPADHYGHKNVLFRDLADDQVPLRPISAMSPQLVGGMLAQPPLWQRLTFPLSDWANRHRYYDWARFLNERRAVVPCPEGMDVHQLPAECHESAQTPQVLFEKLSQWGYDTLVIPHGTTWGFYTPPGSTFDKQLTGPQHDPDKQRLFEIYSGHGNSEEYRTWKAIDWDANGNPVCPAPTKNYEPCCWRAGELIRARCGNISKEECEDHVATARLNYLKAGVTGRMTVADAKPEDWKDCGQCRDCFNPAFNYRPGNSGQYTLALTNFDDPAKPRRFNFGFIASSDNHTARPGTGYKEYARRMMTEATGAPDEAARSRVIGTDPTPAKESQVFDRAASTLPVFAQIETERQASFFMTGGLVAVHAEGRDRDTVWKALKRREVYGTSGDRILLWFDLLNGPTGPEPMGASVRLGDAPKFRVRAVGAFKQLPGCPAYATAALSNERLDRLCRNECYNPSDERRVITRIEVVRIRPQQTKGEPVAPLIEDPWKRIDCPKDAAGCVAEFEDTDFVAGGRDVTYYVRAIQEPTPAVNAGGMRCEYNAAGECVKAHPCYGDFRTPFDDDCLTSNEERAWSSPIYVGAQPSA